MQLASETRDPDQKISPSIYAALINSLFQNPAPLFAGAVLVALAAVMTALKTEQNLLWPCVAFLIVSGGCPCARYALVQDAQIRSDRR